MRQVLWILLCWNLLSAGLFAEINAATQPGADIGEKVNHAFASFPGGCGTVVIPAGTYTFSTTIVKPRCGIIRGESGYGTTLKFSPSKRPAIVVADTKGDGHYAPGVIADLSLVGPGQDKDGSIGIFIGGDPDGVYIARNAYGDFQNFNRVRITDFSIGVSFGMNAWRDAFLETMITGNRIGVYLGPKSGNTAEATGFTNSQIQNNGKYGIVLNGFGDFYFVSSSCDYNPVCISIEDAVSVSFIGDHIESSRTPQIAVKTSADPRNVLNIISSRIVILSDKPEDHIIAFVQQGNLPHANLTMIGGDVLSDKPIRHLVLWEPTDPGNHQIYTGVRLDPAVKDLTTTCGTGCQIINAAGITATSFTAMEHEPGCAQYPCVVASIHNSHLTTTLPDTPLLNSPREGLYRITATTTATAAPTVTTTAFTDGRSLTHTLLDRTHPFGTEDLWVNEGHPILYAVPRVFSPSDLTVTVERLR